MADCASLIRPTGYAYRGLLSSLIEWYIKTMSKEQVKAVLDRVQTWPLDRQEDAAKILTLMEAQDASVYRLTDEQVEEVRRRRADPNAKRLTLDESTSGCAA